MRSQFLGEDEAVNTIDPTLLEYGILFRYLNLNCGQTNIFYLPLIIRIFLDSN